MHLRFLNYAFRFTFFRERNERKSAAGSRLCAGWLNENKHNKTFYFYFNQSIEKNILQPNLTRGWLCKKVGIETR